MRLIGGDYACIHGGSCPVCNPPEPKTRCVNVSWTELENREMFFDVEDYDNLSDEQVENELRRQILELIGDERFKVSPRISVEITEINPDDDEE